MTKATFSTIILAAGKGTRMRSQLPKVLHQIASKPLIAHVLASVAPLKPKQTIVVVAPKMADVQAAAWREMPVCQCAVQQKQLGTGNAVSAALPLLKTAADYVLVLYGDTPLIQTHTLAKLLEAATTADVTVLGMQLANPTGYGRMVLHGHRLEAIVECKDASASVKKIALCNSGIMVIRKKILAELLAKLTTNNASGEYYLTDIVAVANGLKYRVQAAETEADELHGINTRAQLAAAEAAIQKRLRNAAMEQGATLVHPESVFFAADTKLGEDVVVHPNVVFGAGVRVGSNVEIRSFSHIEGATIASGAVIGPFARLRIGTVIGENAHVGNFVELKATRLGRGAKANHLAYVGDSEVGEGANIGAGTITCNYDGVNKHKTSIGAGAFIGSNSSLVAPVSIGKNAVVGAGSVITENVPEGALALARARQVVKIRHSKKMAKTSD